MPSVASENLIRPSCSVCATRPAKVNPSKWGFVRFTTQAHWEDGDGSGLIEAITPSKTIRAFWRTQHNSNAWPFLLLEEKFILLLETMVKSNGYAHADGSEGWVSGYSYLLDAR
jgi:hypothetical protein